MKRIIGISNSIKGIVFGALIIIVLILILDNNPNATIGSSGYPEPEEGVGQDGSVTEIVVALTDVWVRSQIKTPAATAVPVRYPVGSIEDIINVVLNDPFFGDVHQEDFGLCLKANHSGKPLFVRSLQVDWPNYYVIPFFKDGEVCGIYHVVVQNGMGTVVGWGSGYGTQFPPLSSDQARLAVEDKSKQKVIKAPELAFKLIRLPVSPTYPFWLVTTEDDQIYYVIYRQGQEKTGLEVVVINSLDVLTIDP